MSHFSQIRDVAVVERDFALAALEAMGYSVETSSEVRGWNGGRTAAEIVGRKDGEYDVGLLRDSADAPFDVVADWMGVPGGEDVFMSTFRQEYDLAAAERGARRDGWKKLRRERQDDGTLILIGERY